MSQEEILSALVRANQDRCNPPLKDREVQRIAASIARYEPDQVAVAVVEDHWRQDNPGATGPEDSVPEMPDPGPLPAELLRIPGDNRTNVYILGLAHSSADKDRPRKINAEILHTLGLSGQIVGGLLQAFDHLVDGHDVLLSGRRAPCPPH